jgi:molybdenum cofactor biosynthesis enzyme MoaA
MNKLIDPFLRKINYLRISVTDHCNYRCFYCRDEFHHSRTKRSEVLNLEEITRIARIFSELGVSKIRLTGGEPLIRKNILSLVKMLGEIPGISDIPLSTNAHLLKHSSSVLSARIASRKETECSCPRHKINLPFAVKRTRLQVAQKLSDTAEIIPTLDFELLI